MGRAYREACAAAVAVRHHGEGYIRRLDDMARHMKRDEFCEAVVLMGEMLMARGKGQGNGGSGNGQAGWTKFVDIPLAGYAPEQVFGAFDDEDSFNEGVTQLLAAGYRVGLSFNAANDAFVCSVTCKADSDPNAGCTFTAFAGSWRDAIAVALFKHYNVAGGVWVQAGAGKAGAAFG